MDIEEEIKQIVKEGIAESTPTVVFPDVQRVYVENQPEIPTPIVNIPESIVNVTVPEIKFPEQKAPNVTVTVDNSEVAREIRSLKEELNKDRTDDILDALEDQGERLSKAYSAVKVIGGNASGSQAILNQAGAIINPATAENTGISAADSPSIDAFSRWRTSNPVTLFDAQLTYDLAPLVYEQITAEANATIAHNTTDRCALMTFASTPANGKAYMQTFDYLRYQPGKSQLIFVTFNMIEAVANTLKFAGYSDGVNGIEFQLNGTQPRVALYSDTGHGDEFVNQADWNLDKMDGTGASGITLDFTKAQIFVIDFQALYVGRVRVGFDVNGILYYVHQFTHANIDASPYIQSANLPVRCGMTCSATVSTTMNFICCSVISEGGQDDITGYSFSQEGTVVAGNGTDTHILSIQPKALFNGFVNRSKFVLESVDITVTGNSPVRWQLVIGQALSGTTTFIEENATYSAFEYNIAGTLSGSPAITIAQGYVPASATVKQATSTRVPFKYPITLDAAGVARVNGRLTAIVQGIGGTSATRCVFNWKEIR